jgi:hypothetical protein
VHWRRRKTSGPRLLLANHGGQKIMT